MPGKKPNNPRWNSGFVFGKQRDQAVGDIDDSHFKVLTGGDPLLEDLDEEDTSSEDVDGDGESVVRYRGDDNRAYRALQDQSDGFVTLPDEDAGLLGICGDSHYAKGGAIKPSE